METPKADRGAEDRIIEAATASKRRSRWDETPINATPSMTPSMGLATPSMTPSATPGHATPLLTPGGSTPTGLKAALLATPTPGTQY